MGCGSGLLIGFFSELDRGGAHQAQKQRKKKKGRRPTVMLMELIHFSGVRPLPSFSSPRPPTATTTGPGRQSVAAAPPLAEVPQDRDLNLPLLHRVLRAPSAALPTPPPAFTRSRISRFNFFVLLSRVFLRTLLARSSHALLQAAHLEPVLKVC